MLDWMKVRLEEVRSSDRGVRVDHQIVSKERSTSVRWVLRKFRHAKKEEKRAFVLCRRGAVVKGVEHISTIVSVNM